MEILKFALYSFIATTLYSYIFSVPKKSLLLVGLNGSIGYSIYYVSNQYLNQEILGVFLGTLVISILSEKFARKFKMPATIFLTCGIIPLVPGIRLYSTMLSIVNNDYLYALTLLFQTLFLAGSIALAIAITSAIFNIKKH